MYLGCTRQPAPLITIIFTNELENDRQVWWSKDGTKAYDDEANVYLQDNDQIGLRNSDGTFSSWSFNLELPSGIGIKKIIRIKRIPEEATMFKRIDLDINKGIHIYNLPIKREGDE